MPIRQPSAVGAVCLDGQFQRTAWPEKLIAHSVAPLWWKATILVIQTCEPRLAYGAERNGRVSRLREVGVNGSLFDINVSNLTYN